MVGGGCFVADTLLMRADKSQACISTIQPGEDLLAFTSSGEIVTTTVQEIFLHVVDEYVKLCAGENIRVEVTREHPFYVGNGLFAPLNKLHINDPIYVLTNAARNLDTRPITSFNSVVAPSTCVYNLHTTKPHTYFANGIAVHNKMGNLGVPFVDVSNGVGLKRIQFSDTAPSWRFVSPGICLEGKCTNTLCVAHQQEVIINIGFKTLNILTGINANTSKCPVCLRYVEPSTCAFNRCQWRWWGTKRPESGSPPVEIPPCDWKQADHAYYYFDEKTSGTVVWLELFLEAKT
jgi:hypothetical protein